MKTVFSMSNSIFGQQPAGVQEQRSTDSVLIRISSKTSLYYGNSINQIESISKTPKSYLMNFLWGTRSENTFRKLW